MSLRHRFEIKQFDIILEIDLKLEMTSYDCSASMFWGIFYYLTLLSNSSVTDMSKPTEIFK